MSLFLTHQWKSSEKVKLIVWYKMFGCLPVTKKGKIFISTIYYNISSIRDDNIISTNIVHFFRIYRTKDTNPPVISQCTILNLIFNDYNTIVYVIILSFELHSYNFILDGSQFPTAILSQHTRACL